MKTRLELLRLCEEALAERMEVLVKAGRALREIRDLRLYEEAGFKTMEKFCRDRYAMTSKAWEGLIETMENWEALHDPARAHRQVQEEDQ